MTQHDYITSVTRIYRTDLIQMYDRWLTDAQRAYVARFIGLLSRGGGLRLEAIKAEEEARIADLVTRFEQHDATITVVTK